MEAASCAAVAGGSAGAGALKVFVRRILAIKKSTFFEYM
jgi:hypothetical protein